MFYFWSKKSSRLSIEPLTPFTAEEKAKLVKACEKTSKSLQEILGLYSLNVIAVNIEGNQLHPKTKDALKNQWKYGSFPWMDYTSQHSGDPKTFTLALYNSTDLCGLAYIEIEAKKRNTTIVEINNIEGKEKSQERLLKGYVISSFAKAANNIALALDVPLIGVNKPVDNTIPTYMRLGFKGIFFSPNTNKLQRRTTTDINLRRTIRHARRKGSCLPI